MESLSNTNKNSVKKIIPDYLSVDYDTYLNKQIELLKSTEYFKDYNYEGSNIRLLLEWQSYFSELNTYYLNQIAKNVFDDTSELYENKHRIAKLKGYNARGYISSTTDLTIKVKMYDRDGKIQYDVGDKLYVPVYKPCYAIDLEDESKIIPFIVKESLVLEITEDIFYNSTLNNVGINKGDDFEYIMEDVEPYQSIGNITFKIPVIQGETETYTYTGKDIIDNKIILPFNNFNHDWVDEDSYTCILKVNDKNWLRVPHFYDKMSGLSENRKSDDVYQFMFDKFQRYIIEFSPLRNIPDLLDTIEIHLIRSIGDKGNVARNVLTLLDRVNSKGIVKNLTKNFDISLDALEITNERETSGGQNPQSMEDLSEAGKSTISSQERCVTKEDYISFLNARSDVISSYVWGEQEVTPSGDTREYNKVHISVIPYTWYDGTISVENYQWDTEINKIEIFKPIKFSNDFKESLKVYLEPRKFLTTFEVFELPELVFFKFFIGVRLYRLYNFTDVINTIKDKLNCYFQASSQKFNNTINFMDIHNYLLDTSIYQEGKNWDLIKGVENIVFRNIEINLKPISDDKRNFYALPLSGGEYTIDGIKYTTDTGYNVDIPKGSNIYPPNRELDYPQYTRNEFLNSIENRMKIIKLGYNQFPILLDDACVFEEEK